MSKFTRERGTGASETSQTVPSGSMAHRLLVGLTATGGALLLTLSAWVVLAGGDDVPDDTVLPVAADPFLTPSPIPPASPGAADVDPVAPTLNPAAGRDPFVPLVVPLAAPAAGTGATTPNPSVTPTAPNPTPTTTSAPVGKKKQVPTTGPVL
jgi:hypothetical protein